MEKRIRSSHRGQFTPMEDEKLIKLVERYGPKNWIKIGNKMRTRNGRSCRDRYQNYLRPGCLNKVWEEQEDEILMDLYRALGNQWAEIARMLPGRTGSSVKNRCKNILKRKIEDSKDQSIKEKKDEYNNKSEFSSNIDRSIKEGAMLGSEVFDFQEVMNDDIEWQDIDASFRLMDPIDELEDIVFDENDIYGDIF